MLQHRCNRGISQKLVPNKNYKTAKMSARKAPFSTYEKEFLKELIAPHSAILESKKTDADYNKRKLLLWAEITKAYNSSSRCQEATAQQLKKLWMNMKAKARDARSLEKQRKHTGGGPSIPDMAPEHESVLAIVPHIMPTIKVSQDSDGPGDIEDGDDDALAWLPKRARSKSLSPKFKENPAASTSHDPSSTSEQAPISERASTPKRTSTFERPASGRAPKKLYTKNNENSIDSLKIKLIEQDIEHRNSKFEIDTEHQQRVNDIKYKMLLLEYEHKKKLYQLIEKEQEQKLKKASQ